MISSFLRLTLALLLVTPAAAMAQDAPAAPAQPPRPFPEGAKFAFVDIQRIASDSAEGKASTAKVQALNQKKVAELNDMNKQLQADQQKLLQQGALLNEQARAELERSIDRQTKDLQRAQQDAQDEVTQLQVDLQNTFQQKLMPILQQVVTEKGLHILFSRADSGIVVADPGLDLTNEVITRFDASAGASAPPASGEKPQE
jgi:outer membrane protein